MCGIAGIYARANGEPAPSIEKLRKMCDDMLRRGPDAYGEWGSSDGRIILGHRRLSIVDLSAAANQPMIEETSGCALVFNGEIYNFREVRSELQKAGYSFRSCSDTEVLLKGYLHWGEDVLERLRGMYAFALWDPQKPGIWLVRDPYGIKPLYYADTAGGFTFCSQVRPLYRHADVDRSPEPAGVVGFMLLGSVPEPYTCFRGIRALPAGHAMWVSKDGVTSPRAHASISRVWRSAAYNPEVLSSRDLNDRIRAAVYASTKAHQIADVPVGAFLSAGIDSGALVGMMAEDRTTELRTATVGCTSFTGGNLDETILAEYVARQYKTSHQTFWISDETAELDFPLAVRDMDQPSIDGFNTWLVSKHTAQAGLKVAVSGVGGDELFGGYPHFAELPTWAHRLRLLSGVPGCLPVLAVGARLGHRLGLVHAKAEGLARLGPGLAGLYLVRRGLFMPWELPRVLDMEFVRAGLAELDVFSLLNGVITEFEEHAFASIAALEASFYLRNQLLRDSDWASMAHSLEVRTPLVDYHLLREVAPLLARRPGSLSGKRILALSPRPPLPASVVDRPKSGFALPMERWIENSRLITEWRRNRELTPQRVPWARRMAFSLVAKTHPAVVVQE